MARKDEISHTGRIVEINPDFTTVEITVSSACSACHAKGLCGVSEDEEKVIMVPTDPYTVYQPGDEVLVMTKKSMGLKATWISYVIPLAILMILILSLSAVIGNEYLVGGIAIAGVALYYFGIWLFRDRLSNEFVFYIKENNN
ncbi:MAG: SoxR reducing system RseC family protein [Bacteroidales bacterium]|nr:SoxR reducing system RseC family protein [Bacteroidales bacterium]